MRNIVVAFMVLFFASCSTTYPSITEYRIDTEIQTAQSLKSSCQKSSLTVAQVFVKSSLMSKKMKYVVGKYKEFAYNRSEWAENPNRAISDAIVKALQSANIFQTVDNHKSFSRSDYTLESRVDDFSQYYSEDEKESFVKIAITFSLIDNKTAKIIASKHISKEKKTQRANAQSGVVALNELLGESLDEMIQWISGSCK
ncbi:MULTISPECIES: ABC-type transport auxiliary lipoprotein family protein [Sulfurimonas]|uniref:ABC-type transport auxiliary lipoprotein family protein n=1 Tax=Sulfurimonas TaxID=202746 RepID=UPI001265535A|nr:ABC-type transport auxiliary lipoprotein family protein [Sulfurimonas indica]